MKHLLLALLLLGFLPVSAQIEASDFRNFPLVITIQFHSMSVPFRGMKSNFKNVGIGLGTELSYDGAHHWVQQFNVVWYRNKAVGNGLLLSSTMAWRPYLIGNAYGEIKAGIGYELSSRPTQSFKQENGVWTSVGKKGKGMLALPIGIALGHHSYQPSTFVSPFVGYQLMLLTGFNKSVPVIPQTLLQVGSRVHFQAK